MADIATVTAALVAVDLTELTAAQKAARVHCSISWPEGDRCLNCRAPYPCPAFQWASELLIASGWTPAQIRALDIRKGPWA